MEPDLGWLVLPSLTSFLGSWFHKAMSLCFMKQGHGITLASDAETLKALQSAHGGACSERKADIPGLVFCQ